MKKIALLCLLFVLAGCATQQPISPEVKAAVEKPLICEGKDQCDLYWQRSMFYVNNNSRYKIQTSNENLIQTYSPTGGTPSVGYNISREPLGNGRFRIWIKVYCDNMFGCVPEVYPEIAKVKRYISSGM